MRILVLNTVLVLFGLQALQGGARALVDPDIMAVSGVVTNAGNDHVGIWITDQPRFGVRVILRVSPESVMDLDGEKVRDVRMLEPGFRVHAIVYRRDNTIKYLSATNKAPMR